MRPPLRLLQLFCCELSAGCNLAPVHPLCPIRDTRRWTRLDTRRRLDDQTIVRLARQAYQEFGFEGLMGFHFYNEPLVTKQRMFSLMHRIRAAVPAARFILYTNGTLITPPGTELAGFEEIRITNYSGRDFEFLRGIVPRLLVARPAFDTRRDPAATVSDAPCLRPYVEMIVDMYGNLHVCSIDWQGQHSPGNVFTADFGVLVARFLALRRRLAGRTMASDAPRMCRACPHRYPEIACYDSAIARRSTRAVARLRLWTSAQPWCRLWSNRRTEPAPKIQDLETPQDSTV